MPEFHNFPFEARSPTAKEWKYELLLFWLLETWIAQQLYRDFKLINLVREISEIDIESRFQKWIPGEIAENFLRLSWENIFNFICSQGKNGFEKERIIQYFRGKTIGYKNKGNI